MNMNVFIYIQKAETLFFVFFFIVIVYSIFFCGVGGGGGGVGAEMTRYLKYHPVSKVLLMRIMGTSPYKCHATRFQSNISNIVLVLDWKSDGNC